ncbi:Twitching mobility protein [Limihaloglobus sulfuriphilus]|uniref:Twitching mobility protein n=1 Tax=Limihaloglobus sulfuriphilus TaxID=1851148 RepID=A0A1R7T5Y6_9BACT|nr:PilT/PilU family type 4a pilus ATPase [Limihaloglobus sulfuriphilus]AQQ71996.1 Twitching mobility protein [Limihaloglobus sulfuriphilus]
MSLEAILHTAVQFGASDVHINADMKPLMRRDTVLSAMDFPELSNEDIRAMILGMVDEKGYAHLEEHLDLDFATAISSGHRFRVNAHYQRETLAIAFRVISDKVPAFDDLHLPETLRSLTELPRGLVLVTGPTGSGKSTTLASMINLINSRESKRIITLEDPIEYLLRNDKSQIEQREVGRDVSSFASGLRHALRQDPDVILVGEMRDLETTSAALTAAETGHLVMSTLHTNSASQTIERIIDIYPAAQQSQVRSMLANTLSASVSQTLFKRRDYPGMTPCMEILLSSPAVRNCIRDNRLHEIPNVIETQKQAGMQLLDHNITELFFEGIISKADAIGRASDQARMKALLEDVEDIF